MTKKDNCANCNKHTPLPRSLCWECEKPLCRDCGGKGNVLKAKLREDKALICNKCYDQEK